MREWKRIEPTSVTKVGWRVITSKTFVMPGGNEVVFDTFHPDGQEFAAVIALTADKKVIVAQEYCSGPEMVMDELPGGFVDEEETPTAAARRELLEETGFVPGEMRYLGTYHKDSYMNATWHAFLALDCIRQAEQALESEEDIEIKLMDIDEFIHGAKHDKITDHAVVLMAYDELMKLKEE